MWPYRELENITGVRARRDVPLSRFTTFRIGGPARLMLAPSDLRGLEKSLEMLVRHDVPFRIIGRGSNLLVNDRGVGVVLSLERFSHLSMVNSEPECTPCGPVRNRRPVLEAGAGCGLKKLVAWSVNRGLAGLEDLAGIPASVGGALFMNAGAGNASFGDVVHSVLVVTPDGSSWVKARDLSFSYRKTGLPHGGVVASVRIQMERLSSLQARKRISRVIKRRVATQPLGLPSAGCVFKNFSDVSAGLLIDRCGLKGRRYGGAVVSPVHANFIVNDGTASSSDVVSLVERVRETVYARYGRMLEPEVKYWN